MATGRLAMAFYLWRRGESHLLNVCVHPECQGNGFGRLMVEHLVTRASARSASSIFLEVRPSNRVAFSLYETLGFKQIGVRENYYPAYIGREDAIVLGETARLNAVLPVLAAFRDAQGCYNPAPFRITLS